MRELFLSPHVVLGRDNRGAIGEPLGKEPIPFVPSLTLPLPFFFGVPLGDRVRGGAHDRASAFRCRSRSQSSSVAIFPSGLNEADVTACSCPRSTAISFAVVASQILAV